MQTPQTRRTFFQFLRYYLLIVLLPLILVMAFYSYFSNRQTSDYIIDLEKTNTRNTLDTLDSHMSILQAYPVQLTQSSVLSDFRFQNNQMNHRALIAELKRIVGGNELVRNLVLYFRKSGLFVSAYSNCWNARSLQDNHTLISEEMDLAEFLTTIDQVKETTVLPAMQMRPSPTEEIRESVLLLYSLPVNNRFAYATVMIAVDGAKLRVLMQTEADEEYYLLDHHGRTLISRSTGGMTPESIRDLIADRNTGAQEMMEDHDKVILSWARSTSYGYTLVRVSSMKPIRDRQAALLRITIIILILLSVLITSLIAFVMRRTYHPLKKLASIATNAAMPAAQKNKRSQSNAFNVIENAITSLQTERERLNRDLQKRNPLLAEYSARIMVSTPGEYWNREAYEAGVLAQLPMNFALYQVIVISLHHNAEMQKVLNSLPLLYNKNYVICFAEAKRNRIVLILGTNNRDELNQFTILSNEMIAVGLGPIVDQVNCWNESYIRASLACDCAGRSDSSGQVMRFDEIPDCFYSPSYPWQALQTLSAAVNQGNAETVQSISERLIAFIEQTCETNNEIARTAFQQTLQILIPMFPEKENELTEIISRSGLNPDEFTASSMKEIILELSRSFAAHFSSSSTDYMNSSIYKSLSIISENIGSEDLSLSFVADRIGLSASRYSTLFRHEMNRNFKEYVDSLRFSLAQKLLSETDLPIYVIGQKVGYQNPYSFDRFFKSKAGMTPQTWRQRNS